MTCLLYTSDAADDLTRVDLGGRRIIKKKRGSTKVRARDVRGKREPPGRRRRRKVETECHRQRHRGNAENPKTRKRLCR